MDLKELKTIMSTEDFDRFIELYEEETEIYTPEWFEIEEMKDEILEQYGLDDLYGFKGSENIDDCYDDDLYDDDICEDDESFEIEPFDVEY
jgi:hypothetical protein